MDAALMKEQLLLGEEMDGEAHQNGDNYSESYRKLKEVHSALLAEDVALNANRLQAHSHLPEPHSAVIVPQNAPRLHRDTAMRQLDINQSI